MRVRALIARLIYYLVVLPISIVGGTFGRDFSDGTKRRPNATLVLRSWRDAKEPAAAAFAERLGTDPWFLYALGGRVVVDVERTPPRLMDGRNAEIGPIEWDDPKGPVARCSSFGARGPEFGLYLDRLESLRDSEPGA